MSQYTELLSIRAETLSPIDDDYEEKLLEVSSLFRDFGETLTAFIDEHGYTGDLTDVPAKIQFLCDKFKAANIKAPRTLKEWFMPKKTIKRETAFQICFAFNLNVEETKDFFRRVLLERGFDCHTIKEAVYYFCIKSDRSYADAQAIIDQIKIPKKLKTLPDQEVRYTGAIIKDIDCIHDSTKLINYITNNINDFRYNNVTSIKYIQELWKKISEDKGLAFQEGHLIENKSRYQESNIKSEDDYVVATDDSSTWTIFSQILGMDEYQETKYATKYDRSLTSVLSENALMPLKANFCFPSQHNIDKLIRGELGDNELIRKILILLAFYTYWVKIIINKNDPNYSAKQYDSDKCLAIINKYLLDTGYPELYVGNPYDWIFMWSLNDEYPLQTFRFYMGEVFAIDSERL